jgi:hypothetical protein
MLGVGSARLARRILAISCTVAIRGAFPRSSMDNIHWIRLNSSVKDSFRFFDWAFSRIVRPFDRSCKWILEWYIELKFFKNLRFDLSYELE